MSDPLVESLAQGATVVTVNRRLARRLRDDHDAVRIARGDRLWSSPAVMTLPEFVMRQYARLGEAQHGRWPSMLGPDQEPLLWEESIRICERQADAALLNATTLARAAAAAHALLARWRLDATAIVEPCSDDARAFRRWARAFDRLCVERGWITLTGALGHVIEGFESAVLPAPTGFALAGFDDPPPLLRALSTALHAAGARECVVDGVRAPARAVAVAFPDEAAEIEAAARWCRAVVESDPAARVGVVVPELNRLHHGIVATFREILTPSVLRAGPALQPPFNVSLGEELSRIPVIADAVMALRLGLPDAPAANCGQWLRSAWFAGGVSESGARAVVDARLRMLGESVLPPTRVEAALDEAGAPVSAARLRALTRHARTAPTAQDPVGWAEHFSRAIEVLGWPGERALGSRDFQAVDAFRALLDRLAATGAVSARLSHTVALSRLSRLLRDTLFQPRTESAPIQVMGLLESGGLGFTHLWLLGLDDETWPPPARPHPFVPTVLQRALDMPNSSPEWMLAFAEREIERLRGAAGTCVFSHSIAREGRPLRPSALLEGFDVADAAGLAAWRGARPLESMVAAGALESLADDRAPSLSDGERVPGGTRIFADQIACPFRAFAVHRLGAADVAPPESAVDPRVRGLLAHRVLELFWTTMADQRALLAASDAEVERQATDAVDRALAEAAGERPGAFGARFVALERVRLTALVVEWVAIERLRAPFEVVAPEAGRSESLAGVPVAIRPDRVDRLDDGSLLVIDYKTGRPGLAQWFGERPDDPQLPVYVTTLDAAGGAEVSGAAFGVLDPARPGFAGLAAADGVAPGVTAAESSRAPAARAAGSWAALKTEWAAIVVAAGSAFRDGAAAVDPKSFEKTCRHCAIGPLCRVVEVSGLADSDEDPEP